MYTSSASFIQVSYLIESRDTSWPWLAHLSIPGVGLHLSYWHLYLYLFLYLSKDKPCES